MLNVYEAIRSGLQYNKFQVAELLFVEYTCPIEEDSLGIWTPSDYMLHVLRGKKHWRTRERTWIAESGQTFYIKKGAFIIDQFFEEEFCMLLFFISDEFIRETVREAAIQSELIIPPMTNLEPVLEVNNDLTLNAYFQSLLPYFTQRKKPSDSLLTVKLKELLFNILNGSNNIELSAYFCSLMNEDRPSIRSIMESNFYYNLSLNEYATLCHRSLSSFKREFEKIFRMPPGKWLLKKRVEYATALLATSDRTVSEICMECGFENLAHFSLVFSQTVGLTPTGFRRNIRKKK